MQADLYFQVIFPLPTFFSVMSDLHLKTLHNHTLDIDTCMVAFFFMSTF